MTRVHHPTLFTLSWVSYNVELVPSQIPTQLTDPPAENYRELAGILSQFPFRPAKRKKVDATRRRVCWPENPMCHDVIFSNNQLWMMLLW